MKKNTGKEALIAIVAKYPGEGQVKTRLVPPLTPESAAGLYEAVLNDTIATVDKTCFEKAIFFDPPDKKVYFDNIMGQDWLVIPQSGEDLGQRLKNAFLEIMEHDCPVVIIGSDSPALPVERIVEAAFLLDEDNEIILGPSNDGGFYLIGVKDIISISLDDIFRNIRWSTKYAMEDVVSNINKAKKKVAYTGEWFDLDTEEDLKRTVRWFNMHDESSFMHTRKFIFSDEVKKKYE